MEAYDLPLNELLLEQLPIGLILADENGVIRMVNRMAEEVRRVSRSDLLGKSVESCHPREVRGEVANAVEHMRTHPDGSCHRMVEDAVKGRIYDNTYAGIYDPDKRLRAMALLTQDVTSQRRLEKENAQFEQTHNETLLEMRRQYYNLFLTSLETISGLLDAKDPCTQGHSKHVCEITLKMYKRKYGVNGAYYDLKSAALLHDIGNICIPDAILHKTGALTDEEYALIKTHSALGEKIVKPLDFDNTISPVIRHHHERYDGRGYPDNLSGADIPLGARILAIADTFDAMASDRSYRKALPLERCVREIALQAGGQFDPEWVEVFLDMASAGNP